MKKIIFAMLITVLIQAANTCSAYDNYLGDYHTGYHAYIMTETINYNSYYPADATRASCTIKTINGNDTIYIDYNYWKDYNNLWRYSNSQGYSGYIDSSANISRKALYYILGR